MPIKLIDSESKIPIEQHFRVFAGPGAGKTHWLTNHIRNVLYNSIRLTKSRKIACITYTNIAVETILRRLGAIDDKVEVSTIHSFLYRHILKPYCSFISDEFGLNVMKMDGHDDTILANYSFLKEWKEKTGQLRIQSSSDMEVVEAIRQAKWKFDTNGELVVRTDYPLRVDGYAIKMNSYREYKTLAWSKGVVHHDDVLFFSFQILNKIPFILQVIRSKFPYFFIDEFQDTNPIQTKIVEQIGQQETVVGIIGDKAQSIYGFQGAKPEQFSSFSLPGIVDYQIADNRRSTNSIINLLNTIRHDITQNGLRNINGGNPKVIVGNMVECYKISDTICNDLNLVCLSRNNIINNSMKRHMTTSVPSDNLISKLYNIDSNYERRKTIRSTIIAVEYARENSFRDAIKELSKVFKNYIDKDQQKKEVIKNLIYLLTNYRDYYKKSLFDYLVYIKNNIKPAISNLKRGSAKDFYDTYSYEQLAIFAKTNDEDIKYKTIHKVKGSEYDSVHLILEKETDLSFLLAPNISNEEHRIYYVAISRARDNLNINVPSLSDSNKAVLLGKNIEIINIDN